MSLKTEKYPSVMDATIDPAQIAAAKRGELVDSTGKIVLIVRGGEHAAKDATTAIYKRFAQAKDEKGNAFVFSRSQKAVCATGEFGVKSPLTATQFVEFIKRWFVLAELTTINGHEALGLIHQLSRWNLLTLRQGRYLNLETAKLFADWIP